MPTTPATEAMWPDGLSSSALASLVPRFESVQFAVGIPPARSKPALPQPPSQSGSLSRNSPRTFRADRLRSSGLIRL